MKKDITYEQRVFTNRIVDVDSMSVGNFTSKNIKELSQKDKIDGRFFHTSDTDEWFFCWNGELQKLNLKGVSLSEVVDLTEKIEESVKNANKTSTDAKVAADAAVKNVESLSARIDDIESPSLDGYATEDFVNEKVANLVGSAPETLDTIGELSEALKNNKDLVDVLTKSIGTKQDKIDDLDTIRYNAGNAAADATTKADASLSAAKEYADSLAINYDAAGSAEQALADAKKDAASHYQVKGDYLTEHQDISGKQDVIKDLETIRSGAAAGATALQSVPFGYATESYVDDKVDGKFDTAGSAEQALENAKDYVDSKGYLTEHQDISGKQDVISDLEDIRSGAASGASALDEAKAYADSLAINYDAAGTAAQALVDAKSYVDDMGYATTTQVDTKVDKDELKDYALKTDIPSTLEFTKINSNNNLVKDSSIVTQLTIGSSLVSPNDNCLTVGRFNNAQTSWDAMLWVGSGSSESNRKNQMIVQENQLHYRGELKEASGWIGDFGEYFEWYDGNPNNDDRVGYMVQLNENKIEYSTSFENCIGVVSDTCIITGGCCSFEWHNMYLRDEFGRELKDENGESILNPEYNPEMQYVSRDKRKEWGKVGILGQIYTRQDGTLKVGGFAGCKDGIATDAESGYRVLKIINENVALLLVK